MNIDLELMETHQEVSNQLIQLSNQLARQIKSARESDLKLFVNDIHVLEKEIINNLSRLEEEVRI